MDVKQAQAELEHFIAAQDEIIRINLGNGYRDSLAYHINLGETPAMALALAKAEFTDFDCDAATVWHSYDYTDGSYQQDHWPGYNSNY